MNKLTNNEIQKLLYCIDLIMQNFGYNEELNNLYEKLLKMKED
jgi:hypothetical protein